MHDAMNEVVYPGVDSPFTRANDDLTSPALAESFGKRQMMALQGNDKKGNLE
jgi:hypothetical protein